MTNSVDYCSLGTTNHCLRHLVTKLLPYSFSTNSLIFPSTLYIADGTAPTDAVAQAITHLDGPHKPALVSEKLI